MSKNKSPDQPDPAQHTNRQKQWIIQHSAGSPIRSSKEAPVSRQTPLAAADEQPYTDTKSNRQHIPDPFYD
ncbi:hypothetical protein, partial [Methylobacterium sp. J-068]|uniref:hypothetical protein n=1 Tax=Methylobacterium sp. J-068 TaxID=2836649 RepID=UPI001FB98CC0